VQVDSVTEIRRALAFSVLTQHSIQIMSLATIVILARLLTPEEIGVYAVAASVAFLAIELRALGVGQYLIRETEISDEKIRCATGVMMVVSWSLAVIIAIGSPFIAEFYSEPALEIIFWIIAATFIFSPFSSVPSALLKRNMQFQSLFVVRFISNLARSGSSIGFVLMGYSYYGLAMGALVGAIAEVACNTYFRAPGIPWSPAFSRFKELFRFGVLTSAAGTFKQFSLSLPDLVLGRVATMADVGMFSRGLGVVVFLNQIIVHAVGPVVLPHLSEVKRKGESVGDAYLHAIKLLGAFCWPIFAVVNICAYSMIHALFGDQWDAAVPVASVLAFWAILQSTHSFSYFALVTVEKEKLTLKKEAAIFVARFIAVVAAAPHGLLMVAWAMVFAGIVEVVINTWVISKAVGVSVRRQIEAFIPNLIIAAACWISLKVLSLFIDFQALNSWISLSIIGVSMLVVWLTAMRLTRHEAWDIIIQMAGRFIPGRS